MGADASRRARAKVQSFLLLFFKKEALPSLLLGGFLSRVGMAFNDAHDVALLHDEELLTIELHFRA